MANFPLEHLPQLQRKTSSNVSVRAGATLIKSDIHLQVRQKRKETSVPVISQQDL